MVDAGVKQFWNDNVAKDLKGHGIAVYMKFLTAHPELQKKFTTFATVPLSSLEGNDALAKQAVAVMTKLGEIINSGDLKAATKTLAASHKGYKIDQSEFQKIFPSIVEHVSAAGGDKAAWTKALNDIGAAFGSNQ
ncbi:myoglobin-like [Gigantopelta aegis]|uniref:myoglobin-like n=1 Tax=Gigantopelta aegis TaxID=1735272 RepID=UPI001B88E6EF|nr:myoglobin-like [Gigantopelta aegis]XP_041350362.1 myoglobin-like [Gigantopelta aegis]